MSDVRFKRLSPDAVLPKYHSARASGMDLHAAIPRPVTIRPGEIVKVPTGLSVAIPDGCEGQVRPRSGKAQQGLSIPNAPGTVDSDYRGELMVLLVNVGRTPIVVEPRDRIAQFVIAPVVRCGVREVDDLDETTRGVGGFGSTGT